MKKIILSLSLLLTGSIAIIGQTATDFTVNDCAGTSHHLFAELDAGKVIVMVWVMPCGSCIGPAKTAFNASQTFQTSHPGRVLYYLVDDANNTSCTTLNSWASTNTISPDAVFKSSAILMTDYGSPGMPKVVVLGGNSHTVFDDEIDAFSSSTITTGITNALNAQNSVGINEKTDSNFLLNLFPNPVKNSVKVSYILNQADEVSFEVYNILGDKIKTISAGKQITGKHETQINVESLNDGIYFIQLIIGNSSEMRKFYISRN